MTLDVAGRQWSLDDLRALGEETRTITLHCTTGPLPAAAFTGVGLDRVLADVGGDVDGTTVTATSSEDDYTVTVPLEEARQGFLAWAKDGQPTPLRFIAESGSVKAVAHVTLK